MSRYVLATYYSLLKVWTDSTLLAKTMKQRWYDPSQCLLSFKNRQSKNMNANRQSCFHHKHIWTLLLTANTVSFLFNQPPCPEPLPDGLTRPIQPCIPPGLLNRVPASAGVRAGMSPLPQVTRCDLKWHVSFCSGEACCELLYSVCLYLTLTKSHNRGPL